jgi:hypothetical protein
VDALHKFVPFTAQTSVVYQLQRRVRTLREQLQRRDLHLDLLRRKLSLQEDSVRMKSLLQSERDEANIRFVLRNPGPAYRSHSCITTATISTFAFELKQTESE